MIIIIEQYWDFFANSTVIQVLLQFSFSFSDMQQVIVYRNKQLKMLEIVATDVHMRGWCIFKPQPYLRFWFKASHNTCAIRIQRLNSRLNFAKVTSSLDNDDGVCRILVTSTTKDVVWKSSLMTRGVSDSTRVLTMYSEVFNARSCSVTPLNS